MKKYIFLILFLFSAQSLASNVVSNLDTVIKRLEVFVDSELLEQEDYPSGVVVITSADKVLMAKNFGYSNVEDQIAFDSDLSLLYTGSVSKILTASAILQLVDQGLVDLDLPVERYLRKIRIENPFPTKVTIRHLLTHTAGLSDQSIALASRSAAEVPNLETYLKRHLPPVVWEPGSTWNYSNFAFSLLARVVENVSGLSFSDYAKTRIFEPLGMQRSRIGADYTDRYMSYPYKWKWYNDDSGIYLDNKGQSYTNLIGASGFITTGADMTRFMQAYLCKSCNRLLVKKTIDNAWQSQFAYDQAIPHKQGLGWHIHQQNGVKQLYHDGDGSGIETSLLLLPDKDIGIFIGFNNDATDAKRKITEYLLNQLYPDQAMAEPVYLVKSPARTVDGIYRYMNLSQHTFERIVYLFGLRTFSVETRADHVLVGEAKYQAISEGVFKIEGRDNYLKFLYDENRQAMHMTSGYSTYIKLKWWEYPLLHQICLAFGVVLGLAIAVVGGVTLLRRKNLLSRKQWLMVINLLLIPIAFLIVMLKRNSLEIDYELSAFFWWVFSLPVLALLLYPLSAYAIYRLLKERHSVFAKVVFLLLFAALSSQLLLANYYNLIGYRFG